MAAMRSASSLRRSWWLGGLVLAGCSFEHHGRGIDAGDVHGDIAFEARADGCVPSREICDGRDNDCDGIVDNGNPGGGDSCDTTRPGECASGHVQCLVGMERCVADLAAMPETCDGRDNDCNGLIDDGDPGGGSPCSTTTPGACMPGHFHCETTGSECVSDVAPRAERCDGIDDDCDGHVDNGYACALGSGASPCATVCGSTGTQGCLANCTLTACTPPAEVCDLRDEDCDGRCDPPACRELIYQLRASTATATDRIYSTSPSDGAAAGFILEAGVFYTYSAAIGALLPIFRCYHPSVQRHFIGAGGTCSGVPGATADLLLGYVATSPACGAVPLYEYYCGASGFVATVDPGVAAALAAAGCTGGATGLYAWPGP